MEEEIDLNWLKKSGLSVRVKNAIISNGIFTKNELIKSVNEFKILYDQGGKSNMPGVGRKGINEIMQWLGIEKNKNKISEIRAIELLKSIGYTVTRTE